MTDALTLIENVKAKGALRALYAEASSSLWRASQASGRAQQDGMKNFDEDVEAAISLLRSAQALHAEWARLSREMDQASICA